LLLTSEKRKINTVAIVMPLCGEKRIVFIHTYIHAIIILVIAIITCYKI
jgi:hypothetical protein